MRLPTQAIDVDGDIDELTIRFWEELLHNEYFTEELFDYMNAHITPIWIKTDGKLKAVNKLIEKNMTLSS